MSSLSDAVNNFYERRRRAKMDDWLHRHVAKSLLRSHQTKEALELCCIKAEPMTQCIMLQGLN